MDLRKQPAITLTLHQLQRLVEGSINLDGCDLNAVAERIFENAALCAENGCEECVETVKALRSFRPWPPAEAAP